VLFVEENQDGTTGGSHYCLLDLVRSLDNEKFRCLVMFYESNSLLNDFKKTGAHIRIFRKPLGIHLTRRLKHNQLRFLPGFFLAVRASQFLYNAVITRLYPIAHSIYYILGHNIDIVHVNNSIFGGFEWVLASKITGRKCIAHQRGYDKEIPPSCRFHSSRYDYIFGTSEAIRENLLNLGIDLSHYSTLYDRIQTDEFRARVTRTAQEMRKEFKTAIEQPLIGIVGNLQWWKGHMTVVGAVKILKPKYKYIKCLVVGDISKRGGKDIECMKELKRKVDDYDLNENIIFTGYRSDVPNIVNALDIFIHASIRPEPYGLVVLEAMSLGKAVIASNEGGPKEMIVDGESGFLIEPNNPQILAEKVDVLLSDSILRTKLGENAFDRVRKKFSKLDIQHVENVYRTLLKRKE
jgi:glycosyltransferase involved in cell wall biosynthesis